MPDFMRNVWLVASRDTVLKTSSKRFFLIRFLVGLLFAVVFMLNFRYSQHTGSLNPEAGREFLQYLYFAAICVFGLIVPAMTSRAIVDERATRTLDMMRMTPITGIQFVIGKLIAQGGAILLLLITMVPVMAFSVAMGGVTIAEVAFHLYCLLLGGLTFGAFGLYVSTRSAGVGEATIRTFVIIVAYAVVVSMASGVIIVFLSIAIRAMSSGGMASVQFVWQLVYSILMAPFMVFALPTQPPGTAIGWGWWMNILPQAVCLLWIAGMLRFAVRGLARDPSTSKRRFRRTIKVKDTPRRSRTEVLQRIQSGYRDVPAYGRRMEPSQPQASTGQTAPTTEPVSQPAPGTVPPPLPQADAKTPPPLPGTVPPPLPGTTPPTPQTQAPKPPPARPIPPKRPHRLLRDLPLGTRNPVYWKELLMGAPGKLQTTAIVMLVLNLAVGGLLLAIALLSLQELFSSGNAVYFRLLYTVSAYIFLSVGILLIPILGASTFADERSSKTLPLLLLTPLSVKDIWNGKIRACIRLMRWNLLFLACVTVLAILTAMAPLSPIIGTAVVLTTLYALLEGSMFLALSTHRFTHSGRTALLAAIVWFGGIPLLAALLSTTIPGFNAENLLAWVNPFGALAELPTTIMGRKQDWIFLHDGLIPGFLYSVAMFVFATIFRRAGLRKLPTTAVTD